MTRSETSPDLRREIIKPGNLVRDRFGRTYIVLTVEDSIVEVTHYSEPLFFFIPATATGGFEKFPYPILTTYADKVQVVYRKGKKVRFSRKIKNQWVEAQEKFHDLVRFYAQVRQEEIDKILDAPKMQKLSQKRKYMISALCNLISNNHSVGEMILDRLNSKTGR